MPADLLPNLIISHRRLSLGTCPAFHFTVRVLVTRASSENRAQTSAFVNE
jgi:hypothetical protein